MKNYQILLFSLALVFFICESTFAQDKVILKNGKTFEGELSQADWIHKREVVFYVGEERQEILANSVERLFTNNSVFLTTDNPIILNSINSTKKNLFLEILIEGTAKLLKYPSATPIHYVLTKDSIVVLDLAVFNNPAFDHKQRSLYRYNYKTALMNILNDCSSFSFKSFDDLILSENTLKSFVKQYNKLCGEQIFEKDNPKLKNGKQKNKFRLDITGGFTRTNYTFPYGVEVNMPEYFHILGVGSREYLYESFTYGANASYIFYNVKLNPMIEAGIAMQKFSIDSTSFLDVKPYPFNSKRYSVFMDASFLKVYTGIGFEAILTENMVANVGFGMYQYIPLKANGIATEEEYIGVQPPSNSTPSRVEMLDIPDSYNGGSAVFKLGLRYKRFGGMLQYEGGVFFGSLSESMTSFSAILSYSILN